MMAGSAMPRSDPPEAPPAARREAAGLAAALRRIVRGEVRFDDGTRALYATDASNYRQVPLGVVCPRDGDDLLAALDVCRAHGAPILARGAGTSLAGQCCNVAVVLDCSRYLTRILEIDPDRRIARVEPGVVLDTLRAAAEAHGLTFAPDPATHNRCTIGGMIGNNACGVHSIMAGKTVDNVEALDVVTSDGERLRVGAVTGAELDALAAAGGRRGEIYAGLRALGDRYAPLVRERYPPIPRRVSGYNLDELLPERGRHVARALVGSEGTCVTILEATLRLVESPPARVLVVLGYPDVFAAADDVPAILETGVIGLEGVDDQLVEDLRRKRVHPEGVALLPPGRGWLLAEFGGRTEAEALAAARRLEARVARPGGAVSARIVVDRTAQRRLWRVRESALGASAIVPGRPPAWEGWEDAAVRPDRLGAYLREFRRLLDRYGYHSTLYGHFGDGCVHARIDFDLFTAEGIARFRSFVDEAADLVLAHGGSLSGEHGDGQARGELLPKMFGPELVEAFRAFKRLWDPEGRMNPGKLVDAAAIVEHLRLGTAYRPRPLRTHFAYPDDRGSFAGAMLRCVGVGECRKLDAGVMCPSYMATREERHSTRGRARLLFEMTRGDVLRGGWRDEAVREALDLCLSCKACRRECPVAVDMATYKAEFLAHYYEGRLRPRQAYAFGWIHRWARLAALGPRLANAAVEAPGLSAAIKRLAGIAPSRRIPRFAREPFQRQWRRRVARRSAAAPGRPRVILWPDTFTNYFSPEIALSAAGVLEAAGFDVAVPEGPVCCGRPLYDWGMLGTARRLLERTLARLRGEIARGTPVVVLEPSCASVFRDELVNLMPHDLDARRLASQVFLLAELLERRGTMPALQPLGRAALVQAHCHQRALMGVDEELRLLERAGVRATLLDAGCCGMAGAFGFERAHYEVSLAIGERALLPAVRAADPATLVVAGGFSCREQIAQAAGRRALHLAEVLRMALPDGGPAGVA
jgi:FAD/FMN-containing dehydrogenase/Fe-S oxidoreductase